MKRTENKASDLAHDISVDPEKNWLVDYLRRQRAWSMRTFGSGPRTGGITKHIEKELEEIRQAPNDPDEWLDIVILALDGAWRAGYTPEYLVQRLVDLQNRNLARTYPMPASDDEPSEHIDNICSNCDGDGRIEILPETLKCRVCGGTGKRQNPLNTPFSGSDHRK